MANIKISELNPLLTVQDADVLPIVDNAITKKVTAAILRSYTEGNSVLLTGAQTVAGIKTFTSQLASSVATGTAPFSVASTTKVTNLNADLLDGLSSADFQAPLSGTGIVKSTAGTISYLTDNTANWDSAYNDKINSAAVTGSGTNTLTLTQQDAGTITATWVNGTLIREIRNNTGATLTKGTIVYISGATGNKPTVSKAIATGDSTSAQTFGFVQEDILNNANGYVVVIGDLTGVDTSAFAEGAQLYLSATTAGTFTDVKQYAPNHLVYVGIVTRSHPTLGQIEVNIQNGYELDELHNVAAQSPSNGDILQYVTSTGLWTKIGGTTSAIAEGTNLYFTNARSRSAISLTTTGTSGAATYNSTTGVLNVPNYADTDTGITSLNGLTALTQTFAVGTSGTDFGISSATSTHTFNLPTASATNRGALSSADWTTFNNKQNALTNPITGTGTTNYLPKFTGSTTQAISQVFDDGTSVGIGTATPNSAFKLDIIGNARVQSYLNYAVAGATYYRAGCLANANFEIYNTNLARQDFQIVQSTGAASFGGSLRVEGSTSTFKVFQTGATALKTYTKLAEAQIVSYQSTAGSPFTKTTDIVANADSGVASQMRLLTTTSAGTPTTALLLSDTGAATFSSTVTTSGKLTVDNNSGISILASANFGMNMYFDGATGYSYIDNKYDSAGAGRLYIRTRTNGTPVNALMFLGTGEATFTADATINGVTVGRGAGSIATNTAVGASALNANTTGSANSGFGGNALASNITGANNTAIGKDALFSNTASNNTALGFEAGFTNASGTGLTAIGYRALKLSTGNNNTALGNSALASNSTAADNTAVGASALGTNTTGVSNTGIGLNSLALNLVGSSNTAVGRGSLQNNTASNNTAVGFEAAFTNTSGTGLTAIGYQALRVSTGVQNTAVGFQSLLANTTATSNTAIGFESLKNTTTGAVNTAVGNGALSGNTTGASNTSIGAVTDSGNFSGSVIIGRAATATASNQFVVGSSGYPAGAVATEVNASSKVWNVIINGVAQKILLA